MMTVALPVRDATSDAAHRQRIYGIRHRRSYTGTGAASLSGEHPAHDAASAIRIQWWAAVRSQWNREAPSASSAVSAQGGRRGPGGRADVAPRGRVHVCSLPVACSYVSFVCCLRLFHFFVFEDTRVHRLLRTGLRRARDIYGIGTARLRSVSHASVSIVAEEDRAWWRALEPCVP